MKKRILVTFVVFLIYIFTISAGQYIMPWYEVESWEIDVCSKWGGTEQAGIINTGIVGTSFLGQTTATIQAQKTTINDSEEGLSIIYEVAWYFQPIGSDQAYKVQLLGPGRTDEIYKGSATVTNGDSGYHAEETDKNYDKAKILYETGTLLVPIVEK